MPEFVLNVGDSKEDCRRFYGLDLFTQGYIEALFFTETGPDNEIPEGTPVSALSDAAWSRIKGDCKTFQGLNRSLLENAYDAEGYDEEQAGRDFLYTRNGHGVGYWSRELGDIGDWLSKRCGWGTDFGQIDLYPGDDGRLHLF